MSEVIIRHPTVKITCPLGDVSTDFLNFNAAVNTHSTASFAAFSGQEASNTPTPVFSAAAAKLMGKAQTLGFSRRTAFDTTITMDDGGKNVLEFNGFLTSPTFMMDTRSVKPGFAVVAESSLLANLKMDAYTTITGRKETGKALSNGYLTAADEATSSNFAERLTELTMKMIEYWEKNQLSVKKTPNKQLLDQRHQINQAGPLNMWYSLLSNSRSEQLTPWLPVLAKHKTINKLFNSEILSILRGTTRDFQETLDTLLGEFQLMIVPNRSGKAGRIISMDGVMTATPEDLVLPATSILLNGNSSQTLLPLQQVLARGLPRSTYLTQLTTQKRTEDEGLYVGGFPEIAPSGSGDVSFIPIPHFLSEAIAALPENPKPGRSAPTPESFIASYSSIEDLGRAYSNEIADKMVKQYCRSVYLDRALAGTSASIQLPANLKIWPGSRYRVKSAAGEELFTGFLGGIQHSFQRGSGGGSASTTCNFTHIVFPGFTLPGL